MTKQREIIMSVINNSERHYTADEIFVLAKFKMPSIAMATIYNNLNALCEAGVIHRLHIDGAADVFDKILQPHDHLLCDRCGKVSNFFIPDVAQSLKKQIGEGFIAYDLVAHYICPECKR